MSSKDTDGALHHKVKASGKSGQTFGARCFLYAVFYVKYKVRGNADK